MTYDELDKVIQELHEKFDEVIRMLYPLMDPNTALYMANHRMSVESVNYAVQLFQRRIKIELDLCDKLEYLNSVSPNHFDEFKRLRVKNET